MVTGIVYYCWSCDGHCRAQVNLDQPAQCPRCGQSLTDDCRVLHAAAKTSSSLLVEPSATLHHASRPLAAAS